ncbi:MAG: formate dehydrogenase accessory sulfurtransferase FdhD, partial [Sphingopyxis sp.]
AVMMATPCDLEDFVTGFLLAEGLASVGEIGTIDLHAHDGGQGWIARINLPPYRAAPVLERARRRLGDSSCGLCGVESIETALRALPPVGTPARARPAAIRTALLSARHMQVMGAATAATHAAAFARNDGSIVVLREDVGRHNALDKVIGALARSAEDASAGFLIVTSRCSYELVEKAVRAGCGLLVAISAPTDLAVRRAEGAGLAIAAIARDDTLTWVTQLQPETTDGL